MTFNPRAATKLGKRFKFGREVVGFIVRGLASIKRFGTLAKAYATD